MLSPRIRQFLRLQYIVTTLAGTFLGLLNVEFVGNHYDEQGQPVGESKGA